MFKVPESALGANFDRLLKENKECFDTLLSMNGFC